MDDQTTLAPAAVTADAETSARTPAAAALTSVANPRRTTL